MATPTRQELMNEIEALQKENKTLHNKCQKLEKWKKNSRELMRSKNQERDNLKSKLEKEEFTILSLKSRISSISWCNQQLYDQNNKYEDSLKDLKINFDQNKKELSIIKRDYESLQLKLVNVQNKQKDDGMQKAINQQLRTQNKELQDRIYKRDNNVISRLEHDRLIKKEKRKIKELWSIINDLRKESESECCIIEPNKKRQKQ